MDLLAKAIRLLEDQLKAPAQIHPSPGWASDAQAVVDKYHQGLADQPGTGRVSRWTAISVEDGSTMPEPRPDNPLEPDPVGGPDDGETGPPEMFEPGGQFGDGTK